MSSEKHALRARYRSLRANRHDRGSDDDGRRLAEQVLAHVALAPGAAIAGYWPIQSEIDVVPLLVTLHERGHHIALPTIAKKNEPLIFRAWTPGDALATASFGTREPHADKAPIVPDIMIIPGLAFDRSRYRLGYGGGYYDRTLAALAPRRVLALGVGYHEQIVETLPREPHDQPLDMVITESGPAAPVGRRS